MGWMAGKIKLLLSVPFLYRWNSMKTKTKPKTKVTTEFLISLDCTKEENKARLNRFLWKIKPVAKLAEREGIETNGKLHTELLENALMGICEHYGYNLQGIEAYRETNEQNKKVFQFWHMGLLDSERKWIGTVNGITLWEVVAKSLIKIYADIMKGRNEK